MVSLPYANEGVFIIFASQSKKGGLKVCFMENRGCSTSEN
jgi:hypothetical protein